MKQTDKIDDINDIQFLNIASLIAQKYGMAIELGEKIYNPESMCWDKTINFVGDYDKETGIACSIEIAKLLENYVA